MSVFAQAVSGQVSNDVVARVNGMPIRVDEVRYFLPMPQRETGFEQLPNRIQTSAIQLAIDRRLVLNALTNAKQVASDQEIALELDRLATSLARRDTKLSDFYAQQQISPESYLHVIRWQLSWRRYLERAVTDQNLERYFTKHRRDFDGTTMRVAHILWKSEGREVSELLSTADKVLEQIRSSKLPFESAVHQYSDGTKENAGDLGWISRAEPMPAEFNRMAFELNVDEVSKPFVTAFGVHLVRCLEIKSGTKSWEACRRDLTPAVHEYLFDWLANRERAAAKIEFASREAASKNAR